MLAPYRPAGRCNGPTFSGCGATWRGRSGAPLREDPPVGAAAAGPRHGTGRPPPRPDPPAHSSSARPSAKHTCSSRCSTIATPDPDGRGGRTAAWHRLLAEAAAQEQEPPLRSRLLTWEQVAALSWARQAAERADDHQAAVAESGRTPPLPEPGSASRVARYQPTPHSTAALRARGPRLVARHPDRGHPSRGTGAARAGADAARVDRADAARPARAGRRLGLNGPTAARHHGLCGGQDWAGHRRRLLRTLAHTLGTNDIFVALAVAARRATARGQDEVLEEWHSASACERRLCKPDGYGRYRRGRATLSFFLEYDRATERAASYAAKFDAYYRYRASRQAARDYDGFPSVLVVTIDQTAEHRIAEAAYRAWLRHGGRQLAVQITRIDLIESQPDGLLGPIWRTPSDTSGDPVERGLDGRVSPVSDSVARTALSSGPGYCNEPGDRRGRSTPTSGSRNGVPIAAAG